LFEEYHQLSRELGSDQGTAQALNNLALVLQTGGDFAGAKPLCEQALAIFVRLQDLPGAAWLQSRLGDLERKLGDFAAARKSYEGALATFERLGDQRGLARTMVDVAALTLEQGNDIEAHRILKQALLSFRDLENRLGVARTLEEFANFAVTRGHAERALRLAGAAGAIRHSIGAAALRDGLTQTVKLDSARQALGSAALDAEVSGWSMPLEAAIRYALEDYS